MDASTLPLMRLTLEDGLRMLREAAEQAPSIRIDLDDRYLRLIAQAEALPQNQSGADKSWVWKMEAAFQHFYTVARRVR